MSNQEQKMDKYEELLAELLSPEPALPSGLLPNITAAIARRRRIYARMKLLGFLTLSLASFFGLFFGLKEAMAQMSQNGTLEILSLFFSDSMVILAHWQDFSLSVLESLPIWPIILTLGGILTLLISAKFIFESWPEINYHLTLKNNY